MTDLELLAQYAQNGSTVALEMLIERHSPKVYSACFHVLRDATAAEDAAQATFMVFIQKAKTLPETTVLAGWFYTTALHAAQKLRRGELRRTKREQDAAATRQAVPMPSDLPDDRQAEVSAALVALPAPQRDALTLRYVYGLSEEEAAGEMGVPLKTLHSRVTTGLARIREKLTRRETITAAILTALLTDQAAHGADPDFVFSLKLVCRGEAPPSPVASQLAHALLTEKPVAAIKGKAPAPNAPPIWLWITATLLAVGVGAYALLSKPPAAPQKSAPTAKSNATALAAKNGNPAQAQPQPAPWPAETIDAGEPATGTAIGGELSATLNAVKSRYNPHETPQFKITVKNISNREFTLHSIRQALTALNFKEESSGVVWAATGGAKNFPAEKNTLKPGASHSYVLDLAGMQYFRVTVNPDGKSLEPFAYLPPNSYAVLAELKFFSSVDPVTRTNDPNSWSGTVQIVGAPLKIERRQSQGF